MVATCALLWSDSAPCDDAGDSGTEGGAGDADLPPTGDYPGDPIDQGCGCRLAGPLDQHGSLAAGLAALWLIGRTRRRKAIR